MVRQCPLLEGKSRLMPSSYDPPQRQQKSHGDRLKGTEVEDLVGKKKKWSRGTGMCDGRDGYGADSDGGQP